MTAAALVLLSAPSISAQSARGTADTTFALSRNGVIDITIRTGEVTVRGTDRSSAELRARSSNYQLRSAGVTVLLAVGNESGRAGRSSSRGGESDVELLVPRGVRVVIHSRTADARVFDMAGDVEVYTMTGDVHLESIGGRAIVETLAGEVAITRGVGDVRVTTVSGDIVARGIRGSVDVNTTSGDITLAVERTARVQVNGMSSDIDFEGALDSDARLQFTTHSGDVTLRLPESTAGELEASTVTGEVSGGRLTLMPTGDARTNSLMSRIDRSAKRFEFGGGGNVRITVTTFSGDITLQRGARRGSEQ